MWILGGFPPERKEQMSKRVWPALPSTSSSSHPMFCKSRLCNSWELLQRRHVPVTANSPGHGLFVFRKHPWAPPKRAPGATLWSGGWVTAAAWVNTEERRWRVCCSGCRASRERRNVFAAPTAPWVFFPFSCLRLAYLGFHEHCATVWTARHHPPNGWK